MKKDILLRKCEQLIMHLCCDLMIVVTLASGFCIKVDASDGVLTDEELSTLYSLKQEENNDSCLELTVEEAEMLMKIAYHEDHTDALSQAYIMSEVLNRVNDSNYPGSIKEVLNQKNQFLKTDSNEFKKVVPDVNSHIALYLIESGQVQTDFLFHEALAASSSWQSKHREVSLEYGGTRFYR